jgi:hypothetical protein
MPEIERLPRLVVRADTEGRVLVAQPLRPAPSLSWSPFVFGSIATAMTGSGKSIDSSRIGARLDRERVAGRGRLEPDIGGDLARADGLALLA